MSRNLKPRIVLGLMTFGPDESKGARITDVGEFKRCLDYFQYQGYDEIDTARIYVSGQQESFTKAAGWKERGLCIATKSYPLQAGQHKAPNVREDLNKSLAELGTDCVDIFYLHAADRSVPFVETLEALNELHREGKFKELGLSNYSAYEVAEIVVTCKERGWVRPTIYQALYNAITRTIERELIPACRRYGLALVTYNPVAGGLFTGQIKPGSNPNSGRFSNVDPVMGNSYRKRYFNNGIFNAISFIETAAEKNGLSMLEVAFRWLVHHSDLRMNKVEGGNDGIIIGISKFEQLEMNLEFCERGPLPKEVVDALDQAWMLSHATAPLYWHGDLKYGYDTQKVLFGEK
ncbi:aflatoxin B1-aldehyde reductase [Lepidopterella palustris CBS 459.81]|uniref:Aflatoxin B1-aldehyde reductase n=1 Tax=Lepidopterella palustris CBS 459.81 TaxID=1314670 RepID=A0A8E2EJJ7_9PEZI|nr:aflatoxin B1-aldehyde reductase [Lepidopterella palustris CBS 459.81]